MSKKPLISVLMGIYNCEKTLKEATDSLKAQTYDNFEVIMCDDCSSDGTYNVALEICAKDSRFKLIKNEENLGLAPTLNHCLKYAKGKYTARMDGDDICDPTRFAKELDVLENHPEYAVVSCNMITFDEQGTHGLVTYKQVPQKEDFINSSPFCHAGCMMRKDVLKKLSGYDVSKINERVEDYDLWTRLYAMGYKGYNIDEGLYSMRDDRDAFSRRKFKYRINEYKLKKRICKCFSLPIGCRIKAYKPIAVGLAPKFVYKYMHKKKLKNSEN